jgi:hypothetical protein
MKHFATPTKLKVAECGSAEVRLQQWCQMQHSKHSFVTVCVSGTFERLMPHTSAAGRATKLLQHLLSALAWACRLKQLLQHHNHSCNLHMGMDVHLAHLRSQCGQTHAALLTSSTPGQRALVYIYIQRISCRPLCRPQGTTKNITFSCSRMVRYQAQASAA